MLIKNVMTIASSESSTSADLRMSGKMQWQHYHFNSSLGLIYTYMWRFTCSRLYLGFWIWAGSCCLKGSGGMFLKKNLRILDPLRLFLMQSERQTHAYKLYLAKF